MVGLGLASLPIPHMDLAMSRAWSTDAVVGDLSPQTIDRLYAQALAEIRRTRPFQLEPERRQPFTGEPVQLLARANDRWMRP